MTKLLIEMWLDGYETDEEQDLACVEFAKEALDLNSPDIKLVSKESNKNEIDTLINILKELAGKYHLNSTDSRHEDNFRGCTHTICRAIKILIKFIEMEK